MEQHDTHHHAPRWGRTARVPHQRCPSPPGWCATWRSWCSSSC